MSVDTNAVDTVHWRRTNWSRNSLGQIKNLGRGYCYDTFGLAYLAFHCFADPDMMQNAEITGRRKAIKSLVAWAWGYPLGIVASLGSLLGTLGTVATISEIKNKDYL